MTVHAPVQFEIMSLRSYNAEHEERLFGQAKDIASNTSNRKPESVIPNILLLLQAKQEQTNLYSSMQASSSRISKEAEGVAQYTTYKNTVTTHNMTSLSLGEVAGRDTYRRFHISSSKVKANGGRE